VFRKTLPKTEESQEVAAAKVGIDLKTGRKYLGSGQLPSESITCARLV